MPRPLDTAFAVVESSSAEWLQILLLVFGGCCSNVWALEAILKNHPDSGTLLTFAQFVYVTVTNIREFIVFPPRGSGKDAGPDGRLLVQKRSWIPRLKKRDVPLTRWSVQVILFLAVSMLNNFAFSLKIPMTVHIIFRSGGLCVSMLAGYFAGKRYAPGQILASILITVGIFLATISAPSRRRTPSASTASSLNDGVAGSGIAHTGQYIAGVALLSLALVFSAMLGLWQEETYRRHGKAWREGLFYSHLLSLPFFAPLYPTLSSTFQSYLVSPPTTLFVIPIASPQTLYTSFSTKPVAQGLPTGGLTMIDWHKIVVPSALLALGMNVVTQGMCIRGVNRLTSKVSSTTVNLVLTVRKAVSLAISVWYYGSGISTGLAAGGGLVLVLYTLAPPPKVVASRPVSKTETTAAPARPSRDVDTSDNLSEKTRGQLARFDAGEASRTTVIKLTGAETVDGSEGQALRKRK